MRRIIIIIAAAPEESVNNSRIYFPDGSLDVSLLNEVFLRDTIDKAAAVPDAEIVIAHTPAFYAPSIREFAPLEACFLSQENCAYGERPTHAFKHFFAQGSSMVAIGSENPTLPVRSIELAFDVLSSGNADLVLGPITGGGLYLMGINGVCEELLNVIEWDSPRVIEEAVEKAASEGLDWYILPEWCAIRLPDDIERLAAELLDKPSSDISARHTRDYLSCLSECRKKS